MKNNISLVKHATRSLTAIALLLFSTVSFSETLNLGILTSFEAYTVAGAVPNSGGTVTGDIGTHSGIISGFDNPLNTGNHYTANAATEQAQYDLLRLYIHLNELPVNFPDPFVPGSTEHAAAFGSGETLVPGVYTISGAGSITAALTLDGGNDSDAFFVIKMNGAMTVGAGATVALTNGTKSANVFWLINGAISVAADADVKGTLFSKAGAVGLGARVTLEGRMLTMGGEITFGVDSIAGPPPDATTIPIFCESDCIPAPAVDILGALSDFALFTANGNVGNTGISGINGLIGTNLGAITNYNLGTHIGTEEIANALTAQAATDVGVAYTALMALPSTGTGSAAYLNETIAPGVYDIPGAGALGGTIILDAANDSDAIFVFRFAGAFDVAALSKIILANGAKRCNVFWLGGAGVATGAVNIGAASEMKGYFIANNAASNSGGGVFLAGGQFSNFGAVNTNTAVIYDNPECVTSTALNPNPACGLVKTASIGGTGTGLLGEVITYTFAVTNTGPETLTNVVVTDPMAGLVISGSPIASLPVGVVNTDVTGTYTITQADIDAGSVTNSALGTGQDTGANDVTDISGTANDNDLSTVTAVTQDPSVAVVKTASIGGTGLLGEIITYTFAVTNTGPTVLTNVAVTDPLVGLVITGSPIASLAVGASSSAITGTYTIIQADIDAGGVTNSATATDANGVTDISGTATNNDTPTVTTVTQSPGVAVVKTASIGGTGTGILGEVITYTFAVTNTGSTTLTNIAVTDDKATVTGSPIATLAPGASSSAITGTYTIIQADIDAGGVTNTATATDANGVTDISGTATNNDTPTVTTVTQSPGVAVVKTASIGGTGTGILGEVITYTFAVTNTGSTTLTNIVVTDDKATITGSPIATLAPGASSSAITGTYTITQADIDAGGVTNSATATDANGVTDTSGTATNNDTPTVTTVTQSPGVALVKTASIGGTGTGLLGEVITYTFAVTNTGSTTLTNVAVTDDKATITGSPIATLAPGASSSAITGTYTIIQADIDAGGVTNSATATDANGVTDISGTAINNDLSTVTTVTQSPGVALVKTASIGGTGTGILGEVITYTFAVTNTGSTTLTNIVVADPMVGLVITGSPIATLAPGASSSAITGTYTIIQADIDTGGVTNSATATDANGVTDISGTATNNDLSTVTLTPVGAVALVKTATVSGAGTVGDVITYTFAVTNTGSTTLTNIAVTDDKATITGSPIATLAPGASSSAITGTYTIIQADIDAGAVTNTATATDANGVTDISGTAIDNDLSTVTLTPTLGLPDFTPTIDINDLVFLSAGSTKDFVVNISEINGAPSDGQVVILKIAKQSAFLITYGAATAISNVGVGVPVNNSDWDITEDASFITMTLKAAGVIGANAVSAIGFTIAREANVPAQTHQPITVTVVNGSGGDSFDNNNTYNVRVKAQ
jgi:hypothetical protein